jgi:hypothetical protein
MFLKLFMGDTSYKHWEPLVQSVILPLVLNMSENITKSEGPVYRYWIENKAIFYLVVVHVDRVRRCL